MYLNHVNRMGGLTRPIMLVSVSTISQNIKTELMVSCDRSSSQGIQTPRDTVNHVIVYVIFMMVHVP